MRHKLTKEERQRGGKNQTRSDKVRGGKKGFEITMERHPWMSHHLKHAPGMKKFNGSFNPRKNN